MIRKALFGLAGLIGLLVAILLVNTSRYGGGGSDIKDIELPSPPAIDANQAAEHLGRAIQFQTITVVPGDPRPGLEGPWVDMQAWLRETYPVFYAAAEVETVPGTYTLLHTWQGSDPSLNPILLMAHQDVVPVNMGTIDDWTKGPFSGAVEDGYIYGRGALDDKGSMIGLLEALEALAVSGFTPQRTILVMFGHDEEVSGAGAEAGIALLKSRGVSPEMALDEGMLVLDPSPLTGKRAAYIGIAEKGYLTLEITVTAEGGHSSTPPRNSATIRLAKALVALDENQMPSHLSKSPVSDIFEASSVDFAFMEKMAFANQWLFGGMIEGRISDIPTGNAMVRTTTAPTMLLGSAKENVLAQRATALVNFRVHPNDTTEEVIDHVRSVTRDIEGISIKEAGGSGIRGTDASPVSPTDNLSYAVLHAVATEVSDGAPAVPALMIAASDARYASAITPNVYRFMPIVISSEDVGSIHGTDEKLSVENLDRMIQGYAQIILAMDAER